MADEKTKVEPEHKSKRQRSPGYPALNLEQAIGRAKAIEKAEGKNEAPEASIFTHWDKGRSGPALVALAALKYFGLLVVGKTKGRFRLSDLALKIILDDREEGSERYQAIQEAALKPPVHAKMWEKYGANLPSDATLRYYLRNDKGFTDGGAKQFIAVYRATLAFAGLDGGARLSEAGGDEIRQEEPPMLTPSPSPTADPSRQPIRASQPALLPAGVREIPIPIPGPAWPSIKAAFPLSEDAWKQMLEVLQAMKPGLVAPPKEDSGE